MRYVGLVALVLGACGDKDQGDTGGPAGAGCDQIVTEPLVEVPSTEWPVGLNKAIPKYEDFSGSYTVSNSCGDNLTIKLTAPTFESLQVVRTPWTTTTERCGCLNDPFYPDDTQLDPIALLDGFQIFIDSWPDPGVSDQIITGSGALYGPDEELEFRACGTLDVAPAYLSAYEQIGAVVRIPANGGFEATLTLAPVDGSELVTCQFTNFNLQQ